MCIHMIAYMGGEMSFLGRQCMCSVRSAMWHPVLVATFVVAVVINCLPIHFSDGTDPSWWLVRGRLAGDSDPNVLPSFSAS